MLHPDFPVVEGRYRLTESWTLALPGKFNRRIEDGQMVIWRPGFTIWITVWGNDAGKTPQQLCDYVRSDPNPASFDGKTIDHRAIVWHSYRLRETAEQGRAAGLYAFAFAAEGQVNASFYFDSESDVEVAKQIWLSLSNTPAQ
jgi:hypothetical protein